MVVPRWWAHGPRAARELGEWATESPWGKGLDRELVPAAAIFMDRIDAHLCLENDACGDSTPCSPL